MQQFISVKGTNRHYWVSISCPGHGFEVITDMPEQFGLGITSDWESLLPYSLVGILDSALGSIGKTAAAALGTLKSANAQSQGLSFQVWLGTSPIEFPLKLEFDAQTDAFQDVVKPIALLTSAGLPYTNSLFSSSNLDNLLTPPGPILGGAVNEGYGINLKFGRLMAFQDCIIVSANHNYDTRLDKNGYPISGEIELTLRTSIVFGHRDLLHAMGIDIQ